MQDRVNLGGRIHVPKLITDTNELVPWREWQKEISKKAVYREKECVKVTFVSHNFSTQEQFVHADVLISNLLAYLLRKKPMMETDDADESSGEELITNKALIEKDEEIVVLKNHLHRASLDNNKLRETIQKLSLALVSKVLQMEQCNFYLF